MKKLFLFLALALLALPSFSQKDSTQAPYKRFPGFPPISLLLPDGKSYFTKADLPKDKAVLLMLFNPSCSHCQEETKQITQHIDKFSNIHIVMATPMPLDSMLAFREKYKLANFKNITITQDNKAMMPTYFMINNLPFLAFYNRKKELIGTHEGSMSIEKLLATFKN
ncbi:MAG TPA: redoxin domain-containing protein [Chitinophagaceae bacterium]|nr:redoxin domain-containing protein [Chitinophagaceae bacterium]